MHFENVNFKTARIEIKRGGVWVNVGDVDLWKPFGYNREGHTVRTGTSAVGPVLATEGMYVYYNEFKGCKFEFRPGGPGDIATILRNSEGIGYLMDAGSGATKRATLFLDPDTFSAAPTSGTAAVWFRNVTALFNLPIDSEFEELRILLCPTGKLPPEGYYEAGNIVVGPVAVFGWDYSQERITNREANTEIVTGRDGSRHSYRAGDPRRSVRFSWAQGVDVSELRRDYPVGVSDYGYVKTWQDPVSSPVAMRQDGPLLLDGLTDRLDGAAVPVVYLPRIPRSTVAGPNLHVVVDPRQFNRGAMYGRVVSATSLETAVGTEETSDVLRVNTVTVEEEV